MNQDEIIEKKVKEEVEIQSKLIDQNTKSVKILAFTTIITLIFLFILNCWLVLEENYGQWFARSGSIIVILTVWAEVLLFKNDDLMKPVDSKPEGSSHSGVTYANVASRDILFSKYYKDNIKYKKIAATFAVVGTIIWGYGDLIWNFFH